MTGPPLARSAFPVTQHWTYFNHAGIGALPSASARELIAYAERARDEGGEGYAIHETREIEVRIAASRILGVHTDDVAFVKNTTEALGFVAAGLDWNEGDRVIVPACEFPSNLYPWLALRDRGVEVVLVEAEGPGHRLDVDAFSIALDGRPARVVATSWVQFGRGWRVDLAQLATIAHAHEALFVVDAIQGLGAIPASMTAWGVDVACADGHKWLLGPEGLGFMSASERARASLRVVEPGWNSVVHRQSWEDRSLVLDPTARRYEGGTQNYGGMMALGASLDLLLEAGVDAVWTHVDGLCAQLAIGLDRIGARVLSDRSDGGASGIVTFELGTVSPERATATLMTQRFSVRPRGGGVRVAPHGYNTAEEIDAFVAAVAALTQE